MMKRLIGTVAVVAVMFGGVALAEGKNVEVKGSYVWERGDSEIPGDIEATFTPAGEGEWEIEFRFEWEGEDRVWMGNAKGNLENGELEGEGKEERGRERTFYFKGSVTDGVFKGEHGSMRDGSWNSLGSITFAP